jgi:OOP family OmpA-OmpF porin
METVAAAEPETSSIKEVVAAAPVAKAVLRGDKIEILENVQFETGSDHILDESHGVLDEVAAILDEHAEIEHIRVEGHTDSQGKAKANQKLSAQRAEAVRTYLVENDGIDPERLMAEGFGDTQPIADNDTEEGRAQNRRVEFIVVH